jgi:hypothetical protein
MARRPQVNGKLALANNLSRGKSYFVTSPSVQTEFDSPSAFTGGTLPAAHVR